MRRVTAGTVAGLLAAVGGLGAAGWAPGASAAVRERVAAPAVRAAGVPGDGGLCGVSVPYTAGVGGYASYRIPAVVGTPAGTLLAFAEGRVGGAGDSGDIDLVVRRSEDGGCTWGPARVAAAGEGDTRGNPAPVGDPRAGGGGLRGGLKGGVGSG
ncbi:hypothetical protein ACFV0D_06675, partial [Streptomyces sp. NPDC059556]